MLRLSSLFTLMTVMYYSTKNDSSNDQSIFISPIVDGRLRHIRSFSSSFENFPLLKYEKMSRRKRTLIEQHNYSLLLPTSFLTDDELRRVAYAISLEDVLADAPTLLDREKEGKKWGKMLLEIVCSPMLYREVRKEREENKQRVVS